MSLFESASLVVTPNGTKASKLYAIKPTDGSGDLSVTRATTATRVNSAGLIESVASNVPRLDYTNSTCPSILVEPQRTNLLTYSEDFTDTSWLKSNLSGFVPVVTSNQTTAPDGTNTADKLYIPAVGVPNEYSILFKLFTSTNITYTSSIYMKGSIGGEKVWIFHTKDGINYQRVACNLTTQWKRFDLTALVSLGADSFSIGVDTRDSLQTAQPAQNIYIWGAQLEAGSYPTSYIPTTSASVTRNADVISKTGISSLIGQTEGTMFYDGYFGNNTDEVYLFLQSTGSTSIDNSIYLVKDGVSISLKVFVGATSQVSIQGGTFALGQRIKIAAAYKQNDFSLYINGTQIATDSLGNVPNCSNLHLGTYAGDSTNQIYIANKGINSAALFKTLLTNSQLAELTTI